MFLSLKLTLWLRRPISRSRIKIIRIRGIVVHNKKPTVLVVDDSDDILELLKLILEEKNCKVMTANTLGAALLLSKEDKYDALITDYHLGNGKTANHLLQAMGRFKPPNVILATGREFKDPLKEVPGIDYYMLKPYATKTLLTLLGVGAP
jgi:DNA-binding response OmpR family regulator